jgi:branched-chain amino acid transport system ATP-binding protein
MQEPLLRVEKLEVTYHRVITAVQGVSLEVPKGAIVALLGTNGAGKTTTLRAISGFIGLDDARVTDGTITYLGEAIQNREPYRITARGIVLVPERNKVFENLTVAENLEAAATRSGADRRRLAARCTSSSPRSRRCAPARQACCRAASDRCSRSARR